MKKIVDFFKSNKLIILWSVGYFFSLWLILRFIFRFDAFSAHYWWKFFHATLHGFAGFVFCLLMYSAIPIWLAGAMIIHKTKSPIITIPFIDKTSEFFTKIFAKKEQPQTETLPETKSEEPEKEDFPSDMPPELHIPYARAKNHISLTGAISVYNKKPIVPETENTPEPETSSEPEIPIPMDFDISDTFNESDMVPQFTDINFDTPIVTEKELENNTTKYLKDKNIEFETYREFVATEKYLIYEHNDEDFWIMDESDWFASGKQKESPVPELIKLAKQNDIVPVIYLESQNIMDIDNTINKFKTIGIRVIKSLEELD